MIVDCLYVHVRSCENPFLIIFLNSVNEFEKIFVENRPWGPLQFGIIQLIFQKCSLYMFVFQQYSL